MFEPGASKRRPDKVMSLSEAVRTYVADGSTVVFGGMGGEQCVAHAHEIIRQGIKDLVLIGDSPADAADLLVGAGCVRRMEIAYCAYAIAGLAPNFRRAVEMGIPHKVEVEDYSNFTIGLRLLAGAMNVPFMPTRSLVGSDLPNHNDRIRFVDSPYSSEQVCVVPAANPDVALIHVSQADQRGNAQVFGFTSNAENAARAARHVIITCERLVTTTEVRRWPNLTVIPEYVVDAVVEVPYASHPWNFPYLYAYDIPFHLQQMSAFRTRDGFLKWLDEWVYSTGSWDGYLDKVGRERLHRLRSIERKFTGIPWASGGEGGQYR